MKKLGFAALLLAFASAAFAHGTGKGDVQVDHTYAGFRTASTDEVLVFFRGIRNEGDKPERLLRGNTPVATTVELQRTLEQGGAKTAVAVAAIELPAHSITPMRHDKGEYRLLLKGLKQALKEGDRFDLNLDFERTGTLTVKVWLQSLSAAGSEEHKH